jgi:type IV fimbrial biogenesis protein FimT
MVALAVTSLTLAFAVPSLTDIVAKQQRASAVNLLVASLHVARGTAISNNRPVTLCASADGQTCTATPWQQGWIMFQNSALQAQPTEGELLATETPLPDSVTVVSDAFGGAISYQANGQALRAQGGQQTGGFWICSARGTVASKGLWVNASGVPQLVDRQADGGPIVCGT